jgi:UTP--glucose-1-phosphate uridylyltransferase
MRKSGIIRSAVFPVGGLGTGILPATTAAPKGLLPVVDKPLIQYAVEEALGAGVRQMVFVTNRNKRAIEDHFDKAYELESALALHNRYELLTELRRLFPPDVTYLFVRQPEPLGLGHAVGCARVFLSGEPFLVIVPDELVAGPVPAAAQLIECFRRWRQCALATLAPGDDADVVARVEGVPMAPGVKRVTRVRGPFEPGPPAAALAGRFVLTPAVFDHLATTPPRATGEIELVDALQAMLAAEPVLARELDGERFDCGSRLGYLAATLHFGLRHPVVGERFRTLVRAAAGSAPALAAVTRQPPVLRAAND